MFKFAKSQFNGEFARQRYSEKTTLQNKKTWASMNRNSIFRRAVSMYVDGFREMTVGKRLWAIILVKLAILFFVFRLFFFPDLLQENYDNDADRADAVRRSLTGR